MPAITTNTAANTALLYVNQNTNLQNDYLAQLSSGSRVQKASDDPSSLAIGTKLQGDVTALSQAATNAANGQSVLNTADGGLEQISDILQRMKALATQSLSGAVDDSSRSDIDAEYQQLLDEIDSIASQTRFNGTNLIDGTSDYATGVTYMLGTDSTDTITVTLNSAKASDLGVTGTAVDTSDDATSALTAINSAIDTISTDRATVGAYSSRFEFRASVINTAQENAQAAQSSFMDADEAQVETEYNNTSVLTEAGIAALQKANEIPQQLLRLLQS